MNIAKAKFDAARVLLRIGAGALLVLAIYTIGHHLGAKGVQLEWNAERLARAESLNRAIGQRVQQNTVEATRQAAVNTTITKAKNEELAPVVQRIYVDRVRIGAASCGPAPTTETESAGRGDGPDPSPRLVREDVERDT